MNRLRDEIDDEEIADFSNNAIDALWSLGLFIGCGLLAGLIISIIQ